MESYRLSVIPIVLELALEIIKAKGFKDLSELDMYKLMGAVDQVLPHIRECAESLKKVQKVTFFVATDCKANREQIADLINNNQLLDKKRTPELVRSSLNDARENIKMCLRNKLAEKGA